MRLISLSVRLFANMLAGHILILTFIGLIFILQSIVLAPFVILVGLCEVAGIATFALGARDSAPVTSVIASQFAGIAAVSAFVLFGERLSRVQVIGVVVIATGVAALAAVRAL
jgi:drug/metabolite transporter (DMT)-like permease